MAAGVTVDLTGFSVSFNEYLRLISIRRRMDPDEDTLTEVLRLFDPHNTGQIEEDQFRKILSSKQGITEEDIEEMIAGKDIPEISYPISVMFQSTRSWTWWRRTRTARSAAAPSSSTKVSTSSPSTRYIFVLLFNYFWSERKYF